MPSRRTRSVLEVTAAGGRIAPGARGEPGGLDLQAGRAGERRPSDYRAAADHFLRIKQAAPTAKIRAGAEYDAGAALIRLQDWTARDRSPRCVPAHPSRARAAQGSDEADRLRASRSRPAVPGRCGVRTRRRPNRRTRSCAPRHCCLREDCTSSRRARTARSRCTRATSSSSRSRSRRPWRRVSRSPRSTRRETIRRASTNSCRRSCASTPRRAASERPDAQPRGSLGAGALGAGLRALRSA